MFRDARPDDLPALLALEAQFPGDRLSPRQFRHHLRSPRAILRVAGAPRVDARDARGRTGAATIAGYALVLLRAGARQARLYSIAVDRAQRGKGVGAELLRDAERNAREAGAQALRLEVRADNRSAIALYERAGYRVFGRHAGYYDDGADALRFEKNLPQARASTAS